MSMGKALLAVLVFVVTAARAEVMSPGVTLDQVNTAAELVSSSMPEDDPKRETLLRLYNDTRAALQSFGESTQALDTFSRARENASAQAAALQAELARLQAAPATDDAAVTAGLSLPELEQTIQGDKSELTALNARLTEIRAAVDGMPARDTAVRDRLTELVERNAELESKLGLLAKTPQSGTEEEARHWSLQAGLASGLAEKAALDAEMLSRPMRLELLKAQLDKTSFDIGVRQQQLQLLEQRAAELRQVEAADAQAFAELVREGARDKHPLVLQLADENAVLTEVYSRRSTLIEGVRERDQAVRKQAGQLETDLNSIRRKLEVMGMTMAIGQILREQSAQLPASHDMRAEMTSVNRQIRDTSSRQIELEDERRKLRNRQNYVEDLLASASLATGDDLREDLLELSNSRRDLIVRSVEMENTYGAALTELEFSLRRQEDAVELYRDFVAERLLWIPSREAFSVLRGTDLARQVRDMTDISGWVSVLQPLPGELIKQPLTMVALLLVLVLIYFTPRITKLLQQTGQSVGYVRSDQFVVTLQALGWSLVLSVKWPLLMVTFAWLFEMQEGDTGLAKGLFVALLRTAFYFWVLETMRMLLLPKGLVAAHFHWPDKLIADLTQRVVRLQQVFLPATGVVILFNTLYPRDVGGSIAALAMAVVLLAIAHFFRSVPNFVQSKVDSIFVTRRTERSAFLGRLMRLLLTGVPLLSIVAVLMGYTYTAIEMALLLVRTLLLGTGILLVHELGLRWLRITRRRMILKMREEQAQASEGQIELNPDEELLEHDHELLNDEGTKFLNAMLIIGALFGFGAIWSEIFPAFGILESVVLWHQSGVVKGVAATIPVTLADLGYALLVLLVGWVAVRRIPSLLEILLRQRVHVSPASAYAATRVFQYSLITVLVVSVMGILGGSWSKIQWAVAALSVGIGFGLQEIVANFISGLIILFEQPIRVGDTVTVGQISGTVTKIRIRATTIRDWDRRELLVPNKEFVTGQLLNWSLSDSVTRIKIEVGVAYGTDMGQALDIVRRLVHEHPVVLKDPEPLITFDEFGDNSLLISVRFYLDSLDRRLVTCSELRQAINQSFNEAGIVVAFPQRDVHLDTNGPLDIRVMHSDRETPGDLS
jgi:potassium efflux system protein